MIKNINALQAQVQELYADNIRFTTEISILSGLIEQLEERITRLEQDAYERDQETLGVSLDDIEGC